MQNQPNDPSTPMAPPKPDDANYHSTRRVIGLGLVMFWTCIPILIVGIVVILYFTL